MDTPKKILIIQLKQLGDVLISSVLGNNIKKAYPNAEVHYAAFDFSIPVLSSNPNINHILSFSQKGRFQVYAYVKRLLKLRREKYDLIIDCYAKWESVQLGLVLNPKEFWGYEKTFRKLFYDRSFPLSSNLNFGQGGAIDRRLVFTKGLNIDPATIDPRPFIHLTSDEIKQAKEVLQSIGVDLSKPIYCLAPAAKRDRKKWPKSHFVEISKRLLEIDKRFQIYINYGPSEKEDAQSIQSAISNDRVFFLPQPEGLRIAAAIFSLCEGFLGNDGGATHIARAVGCRTFTIFSPIIPTDLWAVHNDPNHPFLSLDKCLTKAAFNQIITKVTKDNSATYMAMITPELAWPHIKKWLEIESH